MLLYIVSNLLYCMVNHKLRDGLQKSKWFKLLKPRKTTEPHDEANSVVLTKHVVASFLDAVFAV